MIITAIKNQVKSASRCSIYLDAAYAFSLPRDIIQQDENLRIGKDISKSDILKYKSLSAEYLIIAKVENLISIRPRSEYEVGVYLRQKKVDAAKHPKIIQQLKNKGLIDDLAFATWWANSRAINKLYGAMHIEMELKSKGISSQIIKEAMSGLTLDSGGKLAELIAKKRSKYPDDRKLISYLISKGFSYTDIKSALSA